MTQTILLVEDNEDNQAIYKAILEHFGYCVLIADDDQGNDQPRQTHGWRKRGLPRLRIHGRRACAALTGAFAFRPEYIRSRSKREVQRRSWWILSRSEGADASRQLRRRSISTTGGLTPPVRGAGSQEAC